MHRITVDVRRLGGGFGGKEDQATAWAVMASLAAILLQKPVKLVLERHDDMVMTGKRHPYEADFNIGLSNDLKILGWEVVYYQNGGASTDLSPAILERTLFHSTNSYFIPHVKATAYSCRTNLPPHTAFRGFGAPQAIFILESAIAMAAEKLGIPAWKIQEKNLVSENDRFPYGQTVRNAHAKRAWKKACRIFHLNDQFREIQEFNRENPLVKKGLAMMPVCFGISFTNTGMNQGMALVHIYRDGSIGISTGAIEMGQGVNTKMVQVAAAAFSVSPGKIRIETTNTSRVANTSPTAASTGADLNGKAVIIACEKLMDRLTKHAQKILGKERGTVAISQEMVTLNGIDTGITWNKLVESAFLNRIGLSESGHYATPVIHFDKTTETGHPFSYYVFGAAIVTVTVDCLRGNFKTDQVQIVHDFGSSINMDIDTGQVEGAVMQGIGWMTMEEVRYSGSGKLLSDTLSTYKVPDVYSAPRIIECKALDVKGPGLAVMGSKAVGEPPFIYGIGVWFAIRNAILAFNPSARIGFSAPLTPEKVLMALWNHQNI
jgi:xanthine dehydrogenase large subunit